MKAAWIHALRRVFSARKLFWLGLALPALTRAAAGEAPARAGAFDLTALKPFTAGVPYEGQETGLYPGAKNEIPEAHRKAGERIAAGIQPLDMDGKPEAKSGRILAVVMGHSNCSMYFRWLEKFLEEKKDSLNPQFKLLNCAVFGQMLPQISADSAGPVWASLKKMTEGPRCSPKQVQVLFLHTTWQGANNGKRIPPGPFPQEMKEMEGKLKDVLQRCVTLFPNLRVAYLTSDGMRHFTGLEPHVWREAFAFKWLIESQIKGAAGTEFEGEKRKLPWLQWGPYLWDPAWDRSYFTDGVHPAPKAKDIFVEKYWKHLSADPVAKAWLFKR